MPLSPVRKMRAWVLFLTTITCSLVVAVYIHLVILSGNKRSRPLSLQAPHYLELFSSVFLFFAYMYSLWCNLYTLPRIARAVIMSTLAITLLVAEFMFLVDKIQGSNKITHFLLLKDGADPSKSSPFLCDANADVGCYLESSNQFISIITGLFVLAEVVVTLVVKEKKKEVMYVLDDRDDDDSDGGSVIIMY